MTPRLPPPPPTNPRVAWFHCFSGIAGDMALGSLIDAGADLEEVLGLLRRLPFSGWDLTVEPVLRGGIAATRAVVRAEDDGVVRTHAHISTVIGDARLPERVSRRALAAFSALAEVEGRLHRRAPEQVHFHEVGGHDAVVDIVGTAAALEVLDIDEVSASAVATGMGVIRSAHGILPNPAPAVVVLLAGVPTYGVPQSAELTTPTGAAILAGMADPEGYGPLPAMRIEATGFGAGSRDLDDLPNCTQVVVGTRTAEVRIPGQPVVLIETNVDDITGEVLAHTISRLLDSGAHDAWVTPIVMKKGRPGYTVSALVDPTISETARLILEVETGTLGSRSQVLDRSTAPREMNMVEIDGRAIRVKVSPGRVKAENDDAAKVAIETGRPLRAVTALAETAWENRTSDTQAPQIEGSSGPFQPPLSPDTA